MVHCSSIFQNTALHRKLQANVEAIRILRKELDKYRTERDQFKLMAETIQLRFCAMKNMMYSQNPDSDTFLDSSATRLLLNEMREKNMKLSTDLARTQEKLLEKEGDILLLRNHQNSSQEKNAKNSTNSISLEERQKLILQLESQKKVITQLKFDLNSLVDSKVELCAEMEAYKAKSNRLQGELEATVRGNQMESTNEIDKLLKENNQLKDRMRNMEKDLETSRELIIKYKVNGSYKNVVSPV